jgi:hypothetical protein
MAEWDKPSALSLLINAGVGYNPIEPCGKPGILAKILYLSKKF